jgi:glycosyltransferase involved in cell wall biosynthesis
MSNKKILHIIQSLGNGGCENMLLRSLPLINDFDHKIITLKENGELAPAFISTGIKVETVCCNGLSVFSGIWRLRKHVKEEKPAIIITYLFHADMIGRIALRNIIETPIISSLRTTYNHPKYFVAQILEWLTKSIVRQYIANSDAVKDFYVSRIGVRSENIIVIPNGIDIDAYENADGSRIIQELSLPDNRFVITCVANFAVNKGHHYLLEAFESVFQENKKAYLILVGDGPERDNLERQMHRYKSKKHLILLGRRNDVPDILRASNCFILPTLFEGMSNAIMEAMAAGLPIITTDIPENRELIRTTETGILVPPRDTEALENAILNLLNDFEKYEMLGINAKRDIREKFDIKTVTSRLSRFLKSL